MPNVGLSSVVYGLTSFFIFFKNRNQGLILLVLKLLAILEIVLVLWDCKNCAFSNCSSVDSSDASHLGESLYSDGEHRCAVLFLFEENNIVVKTANCERVYSGYNVLFDGVYEKFEN